MPFKKKYTTLETIWAIRYSRMKAQAKYRRDEWSLEPDEYMELWQASGVMEHCGNESHQYCMVRKDAIESWCYNNVIIVSRRKFLTKKFNEDIHNFPFREYKDNDGVKT
tara:strand:+ start:735 stop:1061 length:327 start_codon:yes stop_codon:yes gene_type:complete